MVDHAEIQHAALLDVGTQGGSSQEKLDNRDCDKHAEELAHDAADGDGKHFLTAHRTH
jgi:hypothetical protein